jgi:cytochrome c553
MRLRKTLWGIALLAFGVVAAQAANADGAKIVREGNGKGALACVACHGMDGAGQPAAGFPRLAGLNADYLVKQLRDMKQGLRSNPIMQPVAKALNDKEIAETARYYAALPVPPALEPTPGDEIFKKGELLATTGNWGKGLPACFQCHGDQGKGVATHFPAIATQSASYVISQLNNWKNGTRHNDPLGLMKAVAERLSDEEMKAVAAYLASRGTR